MVVSELRGEKIDIIPWNNEPARFVAKALSPARVREVYIDDESRDATVIVPDDQLALAIGKEGLNARLAARLTGWKVDIQSETEFAQAEAEIAFGGGDAEEFSGRCAAILSNGKRCPNASLPGSQYCGVPAHQALALAPVPEDEEPMVDEAEPELEAKSELAPPEAESIGIEGLPPAEVGEVESEAPADVAATHGPDAVTIAHDNEEIDPDVEHPLPAPPEKFPAGIPIEPLDEAPDQLPTPANAQLEGQYVSRGGEGDEPETVHDSAVESQEDENAAG
jgi:transcription termination/antitermination protein NusA